MFVTADPHLRVLRDGRLLVGGQPYAYWEFTEPEAHLINNWLAGERVESDLRQQQLAQRLLQRGMLNPLCGDALEPHELTVIVPVRNHLDRVLLTLDGLRTTSDPQLRVIVIDDGSNEPITIEQSNVTVIRLPSTRGPAAARNMGLAMVATPFVAFVDAGIIVPAPTLLAIGGHFEDENVVGVAPRVRSIPGSDRVSRYDRHRSPIDLGPTPSPVGPDCRVAYVPTACLLARISALQNVNGFDEDLRFGEDVDLVWRLGSIGTLRYDPTLEALHQPRRMAIDLARQRFGYGTGAAELASRHSMAVAPLRMSPWTFAMLGLVLSGHPLSAAGLYGYSTVALSQELKVDEPLREAVQLMKVGNGWAAVALGAASVRAYWPLTLVAIFTRSTRRPAIALVTIGFLRRLLDGPKHGRLNDLVIGAIDDVSAGAGIWAGAIRRRSVRALLPNLNDPSEF